MSLIMFYETNGLKPKKVYIVLSCVLYSFIDNYVCIDYLLYQPKTLGRIFFQNNILTNKFQYITWYWNSRTVNKPCILSGIHDETKFNCDIKFPISSGE